MAQTDLVLIHGWASHPGVFAPVEAALATRYRVHRAVMPGYGDGVRDIPGDVDGLAERLRRQTPAGAVWLAWSTGALPGLALAAGAAPHVGRLNLVAPVIRFERDAGWPHGAKPGVLDAFRAALEQRPESLLRRFTRMVLFPDADPGRARSLLDGVRAARIDTRALTAGLDLLAGADLRTRLADVSVPTTIFHGGRDAVVSCASSEFAVEALPDARLRRIDDAGHAPFITHSNLFLDEFLDHGRH